MTPSVEKFKVVDGCPCQRGRVCCRDGQRDGLGRGVDDDAGVLGGQAQQYGPANLVLHGHARRVASQVVRRVPLQVATTGPGAVIHRTERVELDVRGVNHCRAPEVSGLGWIAGSVELGHAGRIDYRHAPAVWYAMHTRCDPHRGGVAHAQDGGEQEGLGLPADHLREGLSLGDDEVLFHQYTIATTGGLRSRRLRCTFASGRTPKLCSNMASCSSAFVACLPSRHRFLTSAQR